MTHLSKGNEEKKGPAIWMCSTCDQMYSDRDIDRLALIMSVTRNQALLDFKRYGCGLVMLIPCMMHRMIINGVA